MQETVMKMYTEASGPNQPRTRGKEALMIALVGVLKSLDIAVNQAGRV